jgi:hypothetical protein
MSSARLASQQAPSRPTRADSTRRSARTPADCLASVPPPAISAKFVDGLPPVDPRVVALIQEGASSFRRAAAKISASTATLLQLAARVPIMAIGGFNGTDRSMTLPDFQKLVAGHRIHYHIAGGRSSWPLGGRRAEAGLK